MPDEAPVTSAILLPMVMRIPFNRLYYAGRGAVRMLEAACSFSATGLIRNQMAYNAGRNTSVRTVPPKVPPIKVYAKIGRASCRERMENGGLRGREEIKEALVAS